MESEISSTTEKKRVNLLKILRVPLLLLVGAAVGYAVTAWMIPKDLIAGLKTDLTQTEKLLLIPAAILIVLMVIVVHELGHLLTGMAQGFKFQLFIVGPMGIKRNEETDRIQWYFNKEINLAGGLAATIPTNDDPDNMLKFARLIIAGPIASLVLSAILLLIYPYFTGMAKLLLLIGGTMSMLIFLVTIFPAGSPTFMTDGKRFLRLLKPETRNIEMAIMRLSSTYTLTRTYEGLQVADIELMKTDQTPMLNTMANFYAYLHFLSIGEMEKAEAEGAIYRKKAANYPKGFRSLMDKEEARIRHKLGLEH